VYGPDFVEMREQLKSMKEFMSFIKPSNEGELDETRSEVSSMSGKMAQIADFQSGINVRMEH
jgi:hypothetical protein